MRLISPISPMRSAVSYPSPQKSITYPPVRKADARSIRVGSNPAAFNQKASVGPAIPAPELKRVFMDQERHTLRFVRTSHRYDLLTSEGYGSRKTICMRHVFCICLTKGV